MKKFSKLFLSCAAAAALAAAVGTSAMAMTAEYEDGTITLADVTATGDQQTILVLDQDATTVEDSMIYAIDQQGETFTSVKVKDLVAKLTDDNETSHTYYVRIGGSDGSIQKASFTVSNGEVPPTPSTRLLGNVDGNKVISLADANLIVKYTLGDRDVITDDTTSENYRAANVDKNKVVSLADANLIVKYTLGDDSILGTATID